MPPLKKRRRLLLTFKGHDCPSPQIIREREREKKKKKKRPQFKQLNWPSPSHSPQFFTIKSGSRAQSA